MNVSKSSNNKLIGIFRYSCPRCGQGKVFEKGSWFKMPVMKERCKHCDYSFNREPGYFLGAMYISYGLAVFQGIVTFLLCYFLFPGMETIWIPFSILAVILLLSPFNFKLSRVIYIHIFPW